MNGDALTPHYFEVEFPGFGAAAPVPGQVVDLTETVSGAAVDLRVPPIGGIDETFVAPVAGNQNAVVVGWLGGACDERVDLELGTGAGDRPTFTLKLLTRLDGCDAVGVPRRLILTFADPVRAVDFRLDVVR